MSQFLPLAPQVLGLAYVQIFEMARREDAVVVQLITEGRPLSNIVQLTSECKSLLSKKSEGPVLNDYLKAAFPPTGRNVVVTQCIIILNCLISIKAILQENS